MDVKFNFLKSSHFKLISSALSVVLLSLVLHLFSFFLIDYFNKYSFLFTDDLDKYRHYYPHYYWYLFSISRFLKYSLPLMLIGGIIYLSENWKKKGYFAIAPTQQTNLLIKSIISILTLSYLLEVGLYLLLWKSWNGFNEHLWFTRFYLLALIALAYFLVYSNFKFLCDKFKNYLLKPSLPFSISIFRVLFFGYLIIRI